MSSHLGAPETAQEGVAGDGVASWTRASGAADGSRLPVVVVRFVVAVLVAGGVTDLLWRLAPSALSLTTDIVGYPIFYDYDYQRYDYGYYAAAFVFPLLVIGVYTVAARVGPLAGRGGRRAPMFPVLTAGTPARQGPAAERQEPGPRAAADATNESTPRPWPVAALWAAGRVLLPAFVVALECSAARSVHQEHLSGAGGAAGALYVVVVAGAALAAGRHEGRRAGLQPLEPAPARQGSERRWERLLSRANSLVALVVVPLLYLVSRATNVTIQSTRRVVHYPWLPLWAVVAVTALCVALWIGVGRRPAGGVDRREAAVLTWVVGPVLLLLALASLPGALGPFAAFDDAQFLAAPQLVFAHGLFPWKGVYLLHGILGDLLDGAVGMAVFGNSRWGSNAGLAVIVNPATWLAMYAFTAYFCRKNRVVLLGFGIAVATGFLAGGVGKFLLLPVLFIVFDQVLKRPGWAWCGLLAFVMFTTATVTPESVIFVICLVVVVPVFELVSRRRGSALVASFQRTIRVAVVFAGLLAAWAIFLALVGSLGAFIDFYVFFARDNALWGAYPTQWSLSVDLSVTVQFFLPPALWLLTVWRTVAKLRVRRSWTTRDWCMVAAAACAAAYFPEALGRSDSGHVADAFAAAVPLLILWVIEALSVGDRAVRAVLAHLQAVGRGAGNLGRRGRDLLGGEWVGHGASVTAVALVLVVTASGVGVPSGTPGALAEGIPGRLHASSPVAAPRDLRRLGFTIPGTVDTNLVVRLGSLLDQYAGTNGPVFDFANELGITYYLLDRVPGTRVFHVEMAQPAAAQDQVVAELEVSRPAVVLFADPFFGLPDYDEVPQEVRAYIVSQYILDHYRPLVDMGGELVYLRDDLRARSLPPLPPPSQTVGLYFATTACTFGDVPDFLVHPANLVQRPSVAVGLSGAGQVGETIQGWAIDPSTGVPVRAVWAVSDGSVVATTVPGTERPDVASVLDDPGALYSGFSIRLPPSVRAGVVLYGLLPGGTLVPLPPTPGLTAVAPPAAVTAVQRSGVAHRVVHTGAAGFADAENRVRSSVARLSLPRGASLTRYNWFEIRAGAPLGKATYTLTDEPGGPSTHEVSFNTLPRAGNEVFVQVGSCSQWHGYGAAGALYLLRSGHRARGLSVRLIS